MMGKPMSYYRAERKNKYEKNYNMIFRWDIVSDSEISECAFQFINSFSGIV
jgi:hypothetical protein